MAKRRNRRNLVLPVERAGTSRRSFLRMVGYGVAAGTLASCSRAPVAHVVPRLEADAGVTPGRAYWIATTCGGCAAACGALARCVDGRPVKLEGNAGHPVSDGGLCAVGQAQVLSLYDGRRLAAPSIRGAAAAWDAADAAVTGALGAARGRVRLLTGTVSGPSTLAAIARFCDRFGATHVAYDALSAWAVAAAHRETHGVARLPRWRFDRARVVASFGADFLGTWISPVEFAAGWRATRDPDASPPRVSRHWQAEAAMSMTGARADRRVRLAPWETGPALAELCDALAARSGEAGRMSASAPRPWVRELADELWAARGAALVVCGENDVALQRLVNAANERIGAYGTTLDLTEGCGARGGDDAALSSLLEEMRSGAVGALVVAGCNPAYDLPASAAFAQAAGAVPFVAVLADHADETSALGHAVLPRLHPLESWDDSSPRAGVVSLTQPAIRPLVPGRTLRECLARWCGENAPDAQLVRAAHAAHAPGDAAWDAALRRGWIDVPVARLATSPRSPGGAAPPAAPAPPAGEFGLVLHATVAMRDGSQAHNAWLHELSDPVTKCAWDNLACFSPDAASRLGIETGDVVELSSDGAASLVLPALIQPGQHDEVVAVALGYGRTGTDRFARIGPQWLECALTVDPGATVGRNAAPWLVLDERGLRGPGRSVRVRRTGAKRPLACTQDHHRLEVPAHLAPRNGEVRHAVRTTTVAALASPADAVRHGAGHAAATLWPEDHPHERRWGLVVDLAACDGCSACVVACQAENNVPCVGRDEVLRHREMTWLRIDRYWTGEGDGTAAAQQPMMCQHCANAPCETVCPVLATAHSAEGLNQQVYNRCVGTRYCANNCPYKVRRFNWFDYPREDARENLALNPGVTVRTRGVMEKCSLCVQRIQEAKAEAAVRGIPLADGDATTACAQSCPSRAIVFGDLADPASAVSRRAAGRRAYQVLAELNVAPGVTYLADVRNRPEGPRHGE